ncbi:MAG: YggS family pyridoxal phosphate-dependent enzyme [Gammaproteobacteria bacterium]|nr:YggS family pyridoxal phosphate-dependent enzyme [Gammaproteobacteria bacterium]MBQ0839136.1 YggS family pyridoxal phosphate-dependent enzyme [Gammaproteobacteria bacterium]
MTNILDNIKQVSTSLQQSAQQFHRSVDAIMLLAVSKGQSSQALRLAWQANIRNFGENYLQEALEKIAALDDLDPCWHFIGPIQSNKTQDIAQHFSWVHSIERLKIARRLSQQRPAHLPPLNVCIQVNIDRETSKSGIDPEHCLELALAIDELPRLKLRGLMVIPQQRDQLDEQRRPYRRAAELLDSLKKSSAALSSLDTLSMGMSGDMQAAIAEGATIIRVGTAIFGPRTQTKL